MIKNHIEHLKVFNFYKYSIPQNKTYTLGYAVAQNPHTAYSELTGRILSEDRANELHLIWYDER